MMVSRLNDAILITRELVKQRWSPMAIMSMGPGWYEDQYLKTLGKLADGPMSFVPWYDPNKPLTKQLEAALAKSRPASTSIPTTSIPLRRCWWPPMPTSGPAPPTRRHSPTRSAPPILPTMSARPRIMFNAKGQNDKLRTSAIQNRGGKTVTVAPKAAAKPRPNGR